MEDEAHREKSGDHMILESHQQVEQAKTKNFPEFNFATVAEVHNDGISLLIGGETEPTKKHYKCNTFCKFEAGQKVYIQKAGEEYIVLFPVGNPSTELRVDAARHADLATTAETANLATTAETAKTADLANTAQTVKNSETTYNGILLKAMYSNQLAYKIDGQGEWNILQNLTK